MITGLDVVKVSNRAKTIFDIERKSNLIADFNNLCDDFKKKKIQKDYTIMSLIEESICDWEFREGAGNIDLYLNNKQININSSKRSPYKKEEKIVFTLELYINLLKWAPSHLEKKKTFLDSLNFAQVPLENVLNPYIENIIFILEQINMTVRKKKLKNGSYQYFVNKRDADVDVTLENDPEIAEVLLSYLDIRNSRDLEFKKNALASIARYLEPKKNDYKSTEYYGLYKSLFFAFNKFGIRHNDDKQIQLTQDEQLEIYDRIFRMAVHLIQSSQVKEFNKIIDNYKTRL